MIKNLITLLLFFSLSLFAQTDFSPYNTKIEKIEKETVLVKNSTKIDVGTTGVVMRSFDGVHKTVIASIEVIKKDTQFMHLKISPFKGIPQEVLPTYNITPKVGDQVILNFLYTRAMAIVPNADNYKLVTKSYDNFDWIHPDILSAKLAKAYSKTPTKELFQEECIANNIGLLLIAVDGKGNFVDCQSFKTLNTIPLPVASEVKTPFYSRIEPVKSKMFGFFGGKGIEDYNTFYTKLLEEK